MDRAGNVERWMPFGVAACALIAYVATLPPSYAFWDTGELQTVSAIAGIAHPPSCPAFAIAGWLAVHLLPFGEPAWRVNAMCAAAMAASTGMLYAAIRSYGTDRAVASVCALGFALSLGVWIDATRAEVHDVALLFRVVALGFALRWNGGGTRADLLGVGIASGLAQATHGITLLLVPALALLVFSRRAAFDGRALATLAAGLATYAYLPLRSAAVASARIEPQLALGLPPGAAFWNYDDPHTWPNFWRVVSAADFDVRSGFAGFFAGNAYGEYATALATTVRRAYGSAGVAAAALGAALLVVRQPVPGIALVLAAVLPVPYTESYSEIQDPSRYYLLTLWCAALAIAIAVQTVLDRTAASAPSRAAACVVLVVCFLTAAPDRSSVVAQRGDRAAADYVADVERMTPGDAVVVADWAYAAPLAYEAYVRHGFGHRIGLAASVTQHADRYASWLRRRSLYLVSFSSHVTVPGFDVAALNTGPYYVYRVRRHVASR